MNVLNWIQQEQKIADYHVITWPTSHFHHPISRTDIVGQINTKPLDAASAVSGEQSQTEEISFGLNDIVRDSRYKSGGFGTDGSALDGSKDAAAANTQKTRNAPRRQSEKEQRGTRRVTKDEVLTMQAENHYLLDSYDKNGQYSTLGK